MLHAASIQTELKTITKNNDTRKEALLLLRPLSPVSPTVYLDELYEQYQGGASLEQIIHQLQSVFQDTSADPDFDLSLFSDYAYVKKHLTIKLVSHSQNIQLLSQVPHQPFLDLEKIVCFVWPKNPCGSILIHHTHLSMWDVTAQELLYDAHVALADNCLPVLSKLDSFTDGRLPFPDAPFYILTNQSGMFGASVILLANMLREFADICRENFFVIPCSVHEVLLLPESLSPDPENLKKSICEINRTVLLPEDVLSDSVYYYDLTEDAIRIYEPPSASSLWHYPEKPE